MIYIFLALLAALAWALWFILQLSIWIPLAVSGFLGLVAFSIGGARWWRARRSARALEQALAAQGQQQVMNARPERRAEIQALQKQMGDGISALKNSRLGGKKRSSQALYSLPWYCIIGPPGAGKTTALKHSGLVFPYADSAVRGVGGTRNCEWWFTNDAILLDTAGRYTTEQGDQEEWLAFLDMLRKNRSKKPLNGLIVAVAMPDIIDSSDVQIEAMGTKLRSRVDEVMTRLRMVLPVYVLITKCDLIAGFGEFFGTLRKSERAQPWGATLPLPEGEGKGNAGALFSQEFDLLVKEIHSRACRRMARERDWRAREAIYQFPLEFAGAKRNLRDLLNQLFMVNAFQGTPIFRGFYFSSGTQEGLPLNRVLQRMGQAMGIRPAQLANRQQVESKSYFLHDVFTKVLFPDANIAARSNSEIRRQRLLRVGVSTTALAVAVTFAVPNAISYSNNRTLLADTDKRATVASHLNWADGQPLSAKLKQLDPVLERLKELEGYEDDGVPFSMRFLMYTGDRLYRPLIRVYLSQMRQGFVAASMQHLEKELSKVRGERYYEEREQLKTYLMLGDIEHLDIDWATGRYTTLWAELQTNSDVSIVELKRRMRPHIRYYFELLRPQGTKKPRAAPTPVNDKVVAHVRKVLAGVPVNKRYYSLFVDSLRYELYDPMGDNVRANQVYPPVTLQSLFDNDRPAVLKYLKSRRHKEREKYYEVEGPYTDLGHVMVLANIKQATNLLKREEWVVPLSNEERGTRVAVNLARLADDYEQQYIDSWRGFFRDLEIRPPANLKEAAVLYAELQTHEYPFLRLLRSLEDHTQWNRNPLEGNKAAEKVVNRKFNQFVTRKTRGLRFNLDLKKIAGKASRVPSRFKAMVLFGVPKDGAGTSLDQYMTRLGDLRRRIVETLDKQPQATVNVLARDLQDAAAETEALLKTRDAMARDLLGSLLLAPLNVNRKIVKLKHRL